MRLINLILVFILLLISNLNLFSQTNYINDDVLGNEIFKPINNQHTSAGWHEYHLNLNSSGGDRYEISSGIYIYKLKTSGSSLSNKMVYLK